MSTPQQAMERTTSVSLDTIPLELLFLILGYLPAIDIDNLAQTLSTRITPACLPLIKRWQQQRRSRKRMLELFPYKKHWQDYRPKQLYRSLKMSRDWGPFVDIRCRTTH